MERITVQKLHKSDNGEIVFLATPEDEKFYYFTDKIKTFVEVGTEIDIEAAELAPGKKARQISKIGMEVEEKPLAEKPQKEQNHTPPEHKSSPETGMWFKEMGDMLRCGDIDKTTPQGKAIRKTYYAEMFRALGIKTEEGG